MNEDDFIKYYDDFQSIAETILDNRERIEIVDNAYVYIWGTVGDFRLEYGDDNENIALSRKEKESLDHIYITFENGDGTLDNFHFREENLYFQISNDSYALVYSIDGKKPTGFGYASDSNYNYYIKKLKGNWYSVTETH
jgi:hypothetical protein